MEKVIAAALAWRDADECEPIASSVAGEKLRELAYAIDDLRATMKAPMTPNETSLVKWGVRITTVSWVCQDGGDNVAFSEKALAEELCRQCTIEAGERYPACAVKYEVVEYSGDIDVMDAKKPPTP